MPLIDIDIFAIVFVEELHRLIFVLHASRDRERIIENVYTYININRAKCIARRYIQHSWLVVSLYIYK